MTEVNNMQHKYKRTMASLKAGLLLSLLSLGASLTPTVVAQAPGTFLPTGNMTSYRPHHTATLLLNGKVLITGGGSDSARSAELYEPVTGRFTRTGDMTTGRDGHSATLLPDGRVLIVLRFHLRKCGTNRHTQSSQIQSTQQRRESAMQVREMCRRSPSLGSTVFP